MGKRRFQWFCSGNQASRQKIAKRENEHLGFSCKTSSSPARRTRKRSFGICFTSSVSQNEDIGLDSERKVSTRMAISTSFLQELRDHGNSNSRRSRGFAEVTTLVNDAALFICLSWPVRESYGATESFLSANNGRVGRGIRFYGTGGE